MTYGEWKALFLFQIGSIKSQYFKLHQRYACSFYSKLVRLKVNEDLTAIVTLLSSFYSKLVRLKVDENKYQSKNESTFLFQIGSIKSPLDGRKTIVDVNVSIPNWFD